MADYSIVADFKANSEGFTAGIRECEESIKELGQKVSEATGKISHGLEDWGLDFDKFYKKASSILSNFGIDLDKFAQHFGLTGKAISAITIAAIGLKKAVEIGQEMNKAMTEIAKGTGKTGEELYKLRENVHDAMVEGVGRSAEEVGKMVADLNTRFGVTGTEVVKLTDEFDKFSKVTGIDTSQAIEQCADVMKKWNIETEDAEKLQDQLTVASQESGASVESLLNGLKSGQAVFSQFGMSATETIAFMADLKQNGIESEQALVGMKTALAKFSQEGINAQEGFAQVKDAIKNAGSETEALNKAVETFGARNGPEMVKVLRNTANGAEEMEKKLLSAGGATEKTFSAMRTSKDAIEDFIGTLEGSFGGLFEGIDTLVKNIIDSVTRVFKLLDPLIRPVVNIIRDTLSTIGEMVYTVINSIADQIEQNSAVFDSMTAILQSVYETIHTILGNTLEAFKTAFSLIFSIINGKWELAWEYTKRIFWLAVDNLLDILSSFLNLFSSQINVFIEEVINPLVDKWNWVAEKLNLPLADKLQPIGKVDLSKLTGVEKKVVEIDKKIAQLNGNAEKKITGTLGKVENVTTNTFGKIEKKAKKTTEEQKTAWEKLKESIKKDAEDWSDVMTTAYNAMKNGFSETFEMIGNGLVEGGQGFEDYAATAVEGIAQVLTALGSQLAAIAAARAASYDYGSAAIAAAGSAAAFVASGVLSAVAKSMKETAEETREANNQLLELSVNALKTRYNLEKFEDTLEEIKSGMSGTTQSIYSGLSSYESLLNKAKNDIISAYADVEKAEYNLLHSRNIADYETNLQWLWALGIPGFTVFDEKRWNEDSKRLRQIYDQAVTSYNEMKKAYNEVSIEIANTAKNTIKSYNEIINGQKDLVKSYQTIYYAQEKLNEYTAQWNAMSAEQRAADKALYDDIIAGRSYESIIETLTYQMGLYNDYITSLLKEQRANVTTLQAEVYDELNKTGVIIGQNLMESLSEGAGKSSFLLSMKNYIKENLLKLAVYTDSFSDKLAEIGNKLAYALMGKGSYKDIRRELEALYDSAVKRAKEVGEIISDVFADVNEEIKASAEQLGEEITNAMIDGLINGSQEDMLQAMKDMIRKLLVQTLVYTEALQSEIASIGEAIAKGIQEGFTETSLHEIRRDLSWTFDQANRTLENIDKVLGQVFGGGYATGTNNAMRGLHLVGEAGPELVNFRGGEQVLNNRNTQTALENAGGTTINQNVVFNNLQDTTAYAMMSQLRQYNREMAVNGIM